MSYYAEGRPDAPLMLVMDAKPSERMESWLWKVVQDECKIQKTDVRIVYLIDAPPENSGNRPSVAQIKQAWPRFYKEILESTPRVVVPMGGNTLKYLTGITQTILDARGYVLTSKYFHGIGIDTTIEDGVYKSNTKWHRKGEPKFKTVKRTLPGGCLGMNFPGYVIPTFGLDHIRTEGFALKPAFKEDIKRAARALEGKLYLLDDRFREHGYYVDWTHKRIGYDEPFPADDLRQLTIGNLISVDIETHGIDNEVIDCVSFSDGTTTATLEWSSEVRDFITALFADSTRWFAVHNSPFDIPRLRANGVFIPDEVLDHRLVDTMFGAVIVQPDLHKSLARTVTVYHDLEPWKGTKGSMWSELAAVDPQFYSAKDAFVTYYLADSLTRVIKSLGMWNLFMGEGNHPGPGVCATIPVLADMSRRGIRTDRDYATRWTHYLERKELRLEKLWAQHFPYINPHSTDQLQKLLYGEWGLPIQRKIEDAMTTDELALIRLRHFVQSDYAQKYAPGPWQNDPRCTPRLFDLILALRDTSKTISTYVQPVALGEIAWVHPSYMPTSKDDEHSGKSQSKGNTATGRLASYGPNIQNQPKKVRMLYVPDSEDMTFIQADYKSAELVCMAAMANDDRLKEDIASGDMHSRNAQRFNVDRKTAKNVTYAGQYLAGAAKVSEMILKQEHFYVPVDECKRILNELAAYYYKTAAYKRHLVAMCDAKHYIRNPFGRVRFFHDGRAPAAVDFIPQSIVADVLWCMLRPVAELAESYDGRLTTTVHDSVLIQVPNKYKDKAARDMKHLLETKMPIVAPDFYIPVELEMAKPGEAWGKVKPYAGV